MIVLHFCKILFEWIQATEVESKDFLKREKLTSILVDICSLHLDLSNRSIYLHLLFSSRVKWQHESSFCQWLQSMKYFVRQSNWINELNSKHVNKWNECTVFSMVFVDMYVLCQLIPANSLVTAFDIIDNGKCKCTKPKQKQ